MDGNWQSKAGVSAGSCPVCEPVTAHVELELHLMGREQNTDLSLSILQCAPVTVPVKSSSLDHI